MRSKYRRHLRQIGCASAVLVAFGIAGTEAFPGGASAATTPPMPTFTAGGQTIPLNWGTGYQLPENWFGVGFEYPELPVKTAAAASTLDNVLNDLTITDDGPLVVRVGGSSAQHVGIYNTSNGMGICAGINADGSGYGNAPDGASPVIDTRTSGGANLGVALANGMTTLSQQPNVELLLDANSPDQFPKTYESGLPTATSPTCAPAGGQPFGLITPDTGGFDNLSETFSQDLYNASAGSGKPSPFYGWELGNEPNATGETEYPPPSDYATALKTFGSPTYNLSGAPTVIAGPAATEPKSVLTTWLQDSAEAEAVVGSRLLITGHTYASATTIGDTGLNDLLSEENVNTLASGVATSVESVASDDSPTNVPYRVDELNSDTEGGVAGVSDSYDSMLWMTDALFSLLNQPTNPNVTYQVPGQPAGSATATATIPAGVPIGVNIHIRNRVNVPTNDIDTGNNGNEANAPFTIPDTYQQPPTNGMGPSSAPITPADTGTLYPNPSLYGMLGFVCAMDATSPICDPAGTNLSGGTGYFIPLQYDTNRPDGGLKIWAVRVINNNGAQLRLLMINKGPKTDTVPLTLSGASSAYFTALTNGTNDDSEGDTSDNSPSDIYFGAGLGTRALIGSNGQLTQAIPFNSVPIGAGGSASVQVPGYSERVVICNWPSSS